MASDVIKITTNESGDWAVLEYGDYGREGHRLYESDFIGLLQYLGYTVIEEEISDEEMEERY